MYPNNRTSISKPAKVLAMFLISLSMRAEHVEGRKCVCTSKTCKEAGVDMCRTRFSCYTELILMTNGRSSENTTTRGCTESATPLLCETKPRPRSRPASDQAFPWIRVPWPRLKCCDTHDYCNANLTISSPSSISEQSRIVPEPTIDSKPTNDPPDPATDPDRVKTIMVTSQGDNGAVYSYNPLFQHRIRPLHVAALVLAVAALISVLAACYVITRFLRSYPYAVGGTE